jgi:hypothetical protein
MVIVIRTEVFIVISLHGFYSNALGYFTVEVDTPPFSVGRWL